MATPAVRSAPVLVLLVLFSVPSFALDAQDLQVKLEPGRILHYKGRVETEFRSADPEVPDQGKRSFEAEALVFVLSLDQAGRARVALFERAEAEAPEDEDLRRKNDAGLAFKSRDGAFDPDPSAPWLGREFTSSLLLGPTTLPRGPLSPGTTWKGKLIPGTLPVAALEIDYTVTSLEEAGGEKSLRITADLGGKRPPLDGGTAGEDFFIELKAGSSLEYVLALDTGIPLRSRFRCLLSFHSPESPGGSEVLTDMAFELQPPEPADGARAASFVKALESLDAGRRGDFEAALARIAEEAAGTPWGRLASGLLDSGQGEAPGAIEEPEAAPEPEGPPGPPPPDFEPSKITLDMKEVTVSQVLAEIGRQLGNPVPAARGFKDAVLPEFKAEAEAFWPLMERLCAASGNEYGKEALEEGG